MNTIENIITFGAGLSVYKAMRDFYKRGDNHGSFLTLGNILVSAECGIVALGLTHHFITTVNDRIAGYLAKKEEEEKKKEKEEAQEEKEEGETTDE